MLQRACSWTVLAAALIVMSMPVGAADMSKWAASYDAATRTRFIPVELWTGGEWDGKREIRLARANLSFGARGEKRITGPMPWTRPGTGAALQVYERDNRGKKQLFALSSRGDGLGRVYDSRCPHQSTDIPQLALQDCTLTCPKHEWQFDVRSGQCIRKGTRPLSQWPSKVVAGRLLAFW